MQKNAKTKIGLNLKLPRWANRQTQRVNYPTDNILVNTFYNQFSIRSLFRVINNDN